jgi:alanyl-tRNA synthetase
MGGVGPCGPCSEIFYDHGEGVFGGIPGSSDQDGDRYMEIWNIVFMQFEQIQGGERIPLQKKSIDTGMGLERISGIMQGVSDNYLTDLFLQIIEEVKTISRTNFANTYPSYKVIADHIRSISFLIADGVFPSNEGRGYVLRRILRRAMRHGNIVGIRDPFLFKLSSLLVDKMRDVYPELGKARPTIESTIHQEEEKFLITLDRGLKILQSDLKGIPTGGVLSGDKAFKLYDTYGFPLDLTQDILKAENISVDVVGFNVALQEQKNRAKWAGSGEQREARIWLDLKEKFGSIGFIGYEKNRGDSEILAILCDGEKETVAAAGGCRAHLITKSTPFYAECGGQCGDVGLISGADGVFRVVNTKKFCDDLVAHEGEMLSGCLNIGDQVELKIDVARRDKISANHTATHLLQAALRRILGDHIAQRGSFLDADRLRFDFSHASSLSVDVIEQIENLVNEWILHDMSVACRTMSKDETIAAGATALFGEKYGDMVRTVLISGEDGEAMSFELCGGTHAISTGRIGAFKILSETSIGSGTRRIEAITGEKVLEYIRETEKTIDLISEKLKCCHSELSKKVEDLLSDLKQKNHEISLNKQKTALENVSETHRADAEIYSLTVSDYDLDELRSLNDAIRHRKSSGIIVVANYSGDKVSLIVSVSADLQKKYNAGQLLKCGLLLINGKGGGSAAFAQGGGVGKEKIASAIKAIEGLIGR